jgi:phosphoribosylaminoimidazolecarboxamide formyltransferase/IMP cyclohydrolase
LSQPDSRRATYRQSQGDSFPTSLRLELGDNQLIYEKQSFAAPGRPPEGLRYGENPGQEAALYRLVSGRAQFGPTTYLGPEAAIVSALGETGLETVGGKSPSMTNFTDLDAGLNLLRWLERPAAVIIKHNNPSGAAQGGSLESCFQRAYQGDELSAFGGVVVFNRPVSLDCARLVEELYVEVVAAPDFEAGSLASLAKRPDIRVFKLPNFDKLTSLGRSIQIKSLLDGGLILHQSLVNAIRTPADFQPARVERQGQIYETSRAPTATEYDDLIFGWAVLNAVSSNSVVVVKDQATVAIAGGQQSRLGVVQLAINKAYQNYCQSRSRELHQTPFWQIARNAEPELAQAIHEEAKNRRAGLLGASLVSDGFFPFRDAVLEALSEGISALAHPGGSLRDWDSIEACNANQPPAAMVFTGQRAFKH